MATGGSWSNICAYPSNICPQCDRHVEILNNDLQFSMDIHMQSHRPLDEIATNINMQMRGDQTGSKSNNKLYSIYTCPDCKENIQCLNNDVGLSIQLHNQKHKPVVTYARSEDQSSTSSGKSRNSDSKSKSLKSIAKRETEQVSILDMIFNTMPPGLQSHRGFISKDDSGKPMCCICNLKVEPIISVSEHLKTKLHEDNTIMFLKQKLPADLHEMLLFVSFYGSNLCCNLCRCKIDLCSENPHETIVNIMIHNAGKAHLSKKTSDCSGQSDEAFVILKTMAQINPLIKENQHLIDYKMKPQFKCKLCDKYITYDEKENVLLQNFTAHLNAAGHDQCLKASNVLKTFEAGNWKGKGKHNFIVSKGGGIHCTVCDFNLGATFEQLFLHVKEPNVTSPSSNVSGSLTTPTYSVPSSLPNLNTPIGNASSTNEISSTKVKKTVGSSQQNAPIYNGVTVAPLAQEAVTRDLKTLLNSLPGELKNVNCIRTNDEARVVCLICNCVIPASTHNLQTHLTGNNHKKNKEAIKSNLGNVKKNDTKFPNPFVGSKGPQDDLTVDQVYGLLVRTDPVIGSSSEMFADFGDGKHYICKLCDIQIQTSPNHDIFKHYLSSHIESSLHTDMLDRQYHFVQELAKEGKGHTVKELFEMLPYASENDLNCFKAAENRSYLLCSLCNFYIPAHVRCLQGHLRGLYHKTCTEKCNIANKGKGSDANVDVDVLFRNIVKTDRIVKSAAKYLIPNNGQYRCKLCETTITRSYDEELFKNNILAHVTGQKHKKKIEQIFDEMLDKLVQLDPVIRSNKAYLTKQNGQFFCNVCPCNLSASDEEESLRRGLKQHLEGSKHVNKIMQIGASTNKKEKAESNQDTFSACHNVPLNTTSIRELFKALPAKFQDDIGNIKASSVEGYIACTLCTAVINPYYLTEHLEDKTHIKKKNGNFFDQTSPTNTAGNQNVTQNRGTLTSLLGNIDKKLPWPVKQ